MKKRSKKYYVAAVIIISLVMAVLMAVFERFGDPTHTAESVRRAFVLAFLISAGGNFALLVIFALVGALVPSFWDRHPRVKGAYVGAAMGLIVAFTNSRIVWGDGSWPSLRDILWGVVPMALFFWLLSLGAGASDERPADSDERTVTSG